MAEKTSDGSDYLAFAKQCEVMAAGASKIDKAIWLSLAAAWRQRATLGDIRESKAS